MILKTVADLRAVARSWRAAGETIGVVPTMGALHDGHLSLARRAMGVYAIPYIDEAQYLSYDEAPVGPEEAATASANYFNYRKLSIFGGSNEIQKNIISKMILGL